MKRVEKTSYWSSVDSSNSGDWGSHGSVVLLREWQRQSKSFLRLAEITIGKGLMAVVQLSVQKFISSKLVVESLTSTRWRLAWLPRGNYIVHSRSHQPTTSIDLEVGIEAFFWSISFKENLLPHVACSIHLIRIKHWLVLLSLEEKIVQQQHYNISRI